MSTSSAGTNVTFGSQAMPEPEPSEPETHDRPPSGHDSGRRTTRDPKRKIEVETEMPGAGLESLATPGGQPADQTLPPTLGATSSVAAEAQQGDGPAAASASGSAVSGTNVASRAVSVVIGPHGAAAACELGVAVVGPQGAAAASNIGVASAGAGGAAAAGNGANSSTVAMDSGGYDREPPLPDLNDALEQRLRRLEQENRELRDRVNGNGTRKRR